MGIKKWLQDYTGVRVAKVKTLSTEEQNAINEAIIKHDQYIAVAEGNKIFGDESSGNGSLYGDSSIFEAIDDGKFGEKVEGTELTESDFWGVGQNVGVDPENVISLTQLRLQQNASIKQWSTMPVARSIVENYKRYCIGRGIKFDCPVPEVGNYLARFWTQNNLEKEFKDGFRDWLLEGEIFWTFTDVDTQDAKFQNKYDTPVIIRRVPSYQIDEIEIDSKDYKTRLAFKRVTMSNAKTQEMVYKDISHPKGDEEKYGLPTTLNRAESKWTSNVRPEHMQMFKYGLTFDHRGRVFMETVLRWNRILSDFAYDRGRINHLRTKVFLIETRTTKSGGDNVASYERLPKGGIKLIESANRSFKFVSPQTGAVDGMSDFKLLGYMIGSGVSMPIHILLQNAENNNYSSISEAGNPFAQAAKDLQDEFGDNIKKMLKYAISQGVRTGELPEKVKMTSYPDDSIGEAQNYVVRRQNEGATQSQILSEIKDILPEDGKKEYTIRTIDAPVQLIFPELVHADPKVTAEAISIYRLAGIWSLKTCIIKSGQDAEVESTRLALEDDNMHDKLMDRENDRATNDQSLRQKDPIKKEAEKPKEPNVEKRPDVKKTK